MYHVDPNYANKAVTCSAEKIQGKTCGEVLRYVCMATGTIPRAGRQGVQHTEHYSTVDENGNIVDSDKTYTVTDAFPTPGESGVHGQSGCVVIYYDKE